MSNSKEQGPVENAPVDALHPEPQRPDPLRQSRLSKTWVGLTIFAVILVLIVDFILQNTNTVKVSFLGWDWQVPLAVALLIAVAGGILVTSLAGTVRIIQLRRRVRRDAKKK